MRLATSPRPHGRPAGPGRGWSGDAGSTRPYSIPGPTSSSRSPGRSVSRTNRCGWGWKLVLHKASGLGREHRDRAEVPDATVVRGDCRWAVRSGRLRSVWHPRLWRPQGHRPRGDVRRLLRQHPARSSPTRGRCDGAIRTNSRRGMRRSLATRHNTVEHLW